MDEIFNNLNNLGSKEVIENTYDGIEEFLISKGYNLKELGKIIREQETQLIVTSAGSGKTTAVTWKALSDIKTGVSVKEVRQNGMTTHVTDRIWISTFLKSGAEDLADTFNEKKMELGLTASTSNVSFSTLHAEFKRALNALNVETNIMSSNAQYQIMREVAGDFGLGSNPGYPTNAELASIITYLSAARNMINPENFYHPDMEEVGLSSGKLIYVINRYAKLRKDYHCVDFEELQELLYKYAVNPETRNPNVTNFLANRYDRIIIDEFQDVSELQYEILKVYAKGCRSIIAVGDDDQSIYSWRGANVDIITKRFAEDFDPVINRLSVNYRCPANVLNPIAKSIVNNKNRYEKPLQSAKEGGELNVFGYRDTMAMARSAESQIAQDVMDGKTVAVLARTNASLLPLSVYLDFQSTFSYSIGGTLYDLDRIKFKRFWRLAYLFDNSGSFLVENLRTICPKTPVYLLRNFVSTLKSEGLTIFTFPTAVLRNQIPDLADFVDAIRGVDTSSEINMLLETFSWVRSMHIDPSGKVTSDEVFSTLELLEMIIEVGEVNSIQDFIFEIGFRNKRLSGKATGLNKQVVLTTVHDYKGKESDCVYIWKDTDTMFPNERTLPEDFEEERRVHYIAGTRAREKSTILTIFGHESPYIEEMGLKPVVPTGKPETRSLKTPIDDFLEGEQNIDID